MVSQNALNAMNISNDDRCNLILEHYHDHDIYSL